jgi:hypothetical protein
MTQSAVKLCHPKAHGYTLTTQGLRMKCTKWTHNTDKCIFLICLSIQCASKKVGTGGFLRTSADDYIRYGFVNALTVTNDQYNYRSKPVQHKPSSRFRTVFTAAYLYTGWRRSKMSQGRMSWFQLQMLYAVEKILYLRIVNRGNWPWPVLIYRNEPEGTRPKRLQPKARSAYIMRGNYNHYTHRTEERYPHTIATKQNAHNWHQCARLAISRLPGVLWTLKYFIKNNNAFHTQLNIMRVQQFY